MLRSLNQKGTNGDGLLGSPFWGVLASEMPTGGSQPGLLDNDVLAGDAADTRYRLRITSQPSAGVLFVQENGAFSFEGAPDGTYSAGQMVEKHDPATNTGSSDTGTIELVIGAASTQVSADLVLSYGVDAYVSADLEMTWSVTSAAATTQVSSDLVIAYSTLARVSSDLVLSWQLTETSGMSFTPSPSRTLTVSPTSKALTGGSWWNLSNPAKPRGAKDPQATLDITLNWAPWLADIGNPPIAKFTATIFGVTQVGAYAEGALTTMVFSGGTSGEATITFEIETATTPPLKDERTVYIDLVNQ